MTETKTAGRLFSWRTLPERMESLVPATSPVGRVLARLPWAEWLLLVLAGAMAFRPATITWNTNPNYSFGWWIPFVAVFLFYERWPTRPAPVASGDNPRLSAWLVAGGLVYFAFRLAAEADPDWRPGLWVLGVLYVGALLAWLRFYGGNGWLRHFAFPVFFLILSVPWFYELERPLTQELMRMNAILVAFSLEVLGVTADALGNIIQLDNCQLGVEEACSGILSLQASLVMGLLLGEIYRLTVGNRAKLVAVCLGSALVGNYLRTLFLGIMASLYGSGAVAAWHDTAGFSILILTAIAGWLASLALADEKPATPAVEPAVRKRSRSFSAVHLAVGVFAVTLGTELVTQGWFWWKESSLERHPAWVVQFPSDSQTVPLSKVALSALMCDSSAAASWATEQGGQWTGMWFEYKPKPSNRVVMGWHTPDNCLPSAGWVKDVDYDEFTTAVNGINLKVRPMKFVSGSKPIFVFWIVYPTSGQLPSRMTNEPHAPVTQKFRTHLRDVWKGNRGVGVETLEMALTGLNDYEKAKKTYLDELKPMLQLKR